MRTYHSHLRGAYTCTAARLGAVIRDQHLVPEAIAVPERGSRSLPSNGDADMLFAGCTERPRRLPGFSLPDAVSTRRCLPRHMSHPKDRAPLLGALPFVQIASGIC